MCVVTCSCPSEVALVLSPHLSRPCDLAAPAGRALREERAQSWQDQSSQCCSQLLWAGLAENTGIPFHLHVADAAVLPLGLPAEVRVRSTRPSVEGETGSSVVLSGVFAFPLSFPKKCLLWWEGCALRGGAFRFVSPGQHLGPLQGCQCPVEPAVGSGAGLA